MSKVYIVQRPLPSRGERAELDLSPAAYFGEIVYALPSGALPQDLAGALGEALADFTDEDYLLPVGNAIACAVAAPIACQMADGVLRLLVWDGPNVGTYHAAEYVLWEHGEDIDVDFEERENAP